MGSIDKLIKALENLRVFQPEGADEATSISKKKVEPLTNKDKIFNCNMLADSICSPNVRSAPEFPNFLGVVIETLLSYTNDKESDVRMVSDECLNRITKVLLDTNLGRLQVEFYKELKKNGPSRCIRSALWRFAELSPLIRPQKRRAYVVNMLPCVIKMAERHEEALQECVMSSMPNICATLMGFASDVEIKSYLVPFISNLCSTSAVVRRVASTCASLVAQHSRKPLQFFNYLLVQVLDMVLPVMHSTSAENMPIMLGSLHCIRCVIPLLTDNDVILASSFTMETHKPDESIKLDSTIMLFELMVHCLQQTHPSVMTAALECYQQLLRHPLPGFTDLMLTVGSISQSVLAASYEATVAVNDEGQSSTLEPELAIEDTDSNSPLGELQLNLAIKSDVTSSGLPSPADMLRSEETLNGDVVDTPTDLLNSAEQANERDEDKKTIEIDHDKEQVNLIGSLTDPDNPPIIYSARLLCHTFLLTGNSEEKLYADREVRVSIKSLALSCLSSIIKLHPECMQRQLYLSLDDGEYNQPICDILLYYDHIDPQIQGVISQVVGNLLHSLIHTSSDDTDHLLVQDVDRYISMLVELLSSDNSMAVRLALSAVRTCINTILNSRYHQHAVNLVERAIKHTTNSYWLVKVELLELLSEVDMLPLVRLTGPTIQSRIVQDVVFSLIGDQDHRVRQSASTVLVRLIPRLYYPSDHPLHSVLLAKAKQEVDKLIYPFLSEYPIECPPMVHGLPGPYYQPAGRSGSEPNSHTLQSALSKVIYELLDMFAASSSQATKLGVCHALFELSESYPVTIFPFAWSCSPGTSCVKSKSTSQDRPNTSTTSSLRSLMVMDELRLGSGGGPLTLVMSLLTHSPLSLDLSVHQNLLALVGNLLSGACLSALKQGSSNQGVAEKSWPGIYDRLLVPSADKLLSHIIKLMNIFSHVLDDTNLTASANPKAVLDAAREAITSPIKKRVANKQEGQATEQPAEPKTAKEAEKAVKNRKETLGTFNHIPFYMKLHEAVKGAHLNYKVSLSLSKMDKFGSMLHQTLTVFSQLLEVASLQEIGKCAEEILEYLKSIVLASPEATVTLVHQLLKALFGTNLSSQYEDLVEKKVISRVHDLVSGNAPQTVIKPGLFTCCLSTPYSELAQSLAHNPFRVEIDDHHNSIYVIKKCQERKMPAVLKSGANVDKNTVGAYIRLFEPLVIKSLKMYTMSSSVALQTQVLSLLVQLIQLRVNYCLLDNDEVFLGYVLKQIDMISEGPPSEQAGLIRCIFQLLLLLSYEKLHSKTLVVVPRIIQLCDGVMASGQNPLTHAIPALEMLVKDLFLSRSINTSSNTDTTFHDIETQREVTASMLLRLIHHTKVLELLSIVLYQLMRESEDKWKKLSRQVIDLLLPLATKQQIELESQEAMFTLHNILLAVSPSVYRPVDMLLKALFTQPHDLESRVQQQRWMSTVLAILRVLLFIGKEEVILSRLNEIEITCFDKSFMTASFMSQMSGSGVGGHMTMSGALSQSSESLISSSYGAIPPQELLASFLTQIICLCTERLAADMQKSYLCANVYKFSLQQLSLLLLFTSHMLQSGHFRKVAKFMMEQLRIESSHLRQTAGEICNHMMWMGAHYPTLTLQWSNILMLLNYEDQSWWSTILGTDTHDIGEDRERSSSVLPLNKEIIKCTGLAMYCDYVVENLHDAEHLTWLTVNHVNEIIDQLHETPVQDYMSAVYSNSAASGLFISAVQSRYKPNASISKLRNVVTCLRNMHKDQSGAVLVLLIDKMISTNHAAISRMCDSVACRRVEVLLAEHEQTVHRELTGEDVMRILVTLHSNKRRHRRLLSLIEKLRSSFFSSIIPPRTLTSHDVALPVSHVADKEFYLQITRYVCRSSISSPKLCASLLGSLEIPDILSMMSEDTFQMRCLSHCIEHGANKYVRVDTGTVIDHSEANGVSSQELSPLLDASEQILKQIWSKRINKADAELTGSLDESMLHSDSASISVDVINATSAYLKFCPQSVNNLEQSELEAICDIAYTYYDKMKPSADLLTRSTSHMMYSWTSHVDDMSPDRAHADIYQLYSNLSLLGLILKNHTLNAIISANHLQVFTIIDSLTELLRNMGVPGLSHEQEDGKEALMMSQDCYVQASQLVTCLSDVLLPGKSCLPPSLVSHLDIVIRGIARLPCVNEHARMPVSAFIMSETRGDDDKPELRADALQDTTVLREFIKRNNLLGWISRHQFEETWACLLHLLSPVAVTGAEDIDEEDDVENIEWMVSALRGITGLLCHTLNKTEQGNTLHKCYKHAHRQRKIQALHSSQVGERLHQLRMYLEQKSSQSCECMRDIDLLCKNLERTSCDIAYNQLSVDYITTKLSIPTTSQAIPNLEKADVEKSEKSSPPTPAASASCDVDIASCLKLLIDVYTHLLSSNAFPKTPLMLLNECAKSTLVLSDLFYERGQFEWMFNTFLELYQTHHNGEDELLNQYVILGLCKAAAIHEVDSGAEEKIHKLIEFSLKSSHIPTKLSAMNGCLYLLESAKESDLVKSLLNVIIEHISKTMDSFLQKVVILSEVHLLTLWSLTFYLIEHFLEQTRTAPTFIPKILQVAVQFVGSSDSHGTARVYTAIMYGFERLLLTNSVSKPEAATLLKLASDRLALPTMHLHVHSVLGLLITCMYADISDNEANNVDMSEVKMELVSILFDRIRRGLPGEAELITGILPPLMSSLFSSQDIMNKVIGEFLSEQQPHPALVARMVYEVFEQQMLSGGTAVLQDWVLLSVSSFTQRNPLATAIWSLTCFFVSASANDWLKGLFPFVSSRIGLLEQVDETVFIISCKDFYQSLVNDSQKKQTFISVFQSAARKEQIYKSALEAITSSESS